MFSYSPTTPSFGQGANYSSSSSPFGSQSVFGAKTNLSNPNPFATGSFGSGATLSGASTGATMFAGNSATGATAFGQPAVFGQTQGSFGGGATPLGTSTGATVFAGNSATGATAFGQPVVFGQTPGSFGSGATPFGTSTGATPFAGNSATGATAFGQPAVLGQTQGSCATATTFGSTSTGPAMFSANSSAFGQLANSSQFGSQSVFGQTNSSSNHNPSGLGSFGTAATPFSTSTGASMFSGNSTGVFGASSFAFGSSSSSTTAPFSTFGTSFSPSTVFGQSPGNAPLVTQSKFGKANDFGVNNAFTPKTITATPFGSSIGGATFGGNSIGSFGATPFPSATKPTFGAPIFNKNAGNLFQPSQSTSANHAFNSRSQSGFSALASGASTNGLSGSQYDNILGSSIRPPFGSTGPAFSSSGAPFGSAGANGVSSTPTFGPPSNFNSAASNNHEPLNSRSTFGQPSSHFGINSGPTALENMKFPLASRPTITTMKFGQSATDGQCRGSRTKSYVATKEVVGEGSTETAAKLVSISAMDTYKEKSHEELRFKDSQFLGNNDWTGFLTSTATASASSSSASNSVTSSETASGFMSGLTGNQTLSLPCQFSEPSVGKTNYFIGPSVVIPHSQPQTSNAISTGTGLWGNLSSSNPSLVSMSKSTGFTWTKPELITTPQITQSVVATQATSATISEQSLAAMNAGTSYQSTEMQLSESQNTMAVKPSVIASPFGMESRLQMTSVGCPTTATTVQYGISCMPVSDKPAPVKRNSRLTARHLSLGRNRTSVEKYQPETDRQKVPFYEEKLPGVFKVGASYVPRENPRSWVLNPMVERPLKTNSSNSSLMEKESIHIPETGNSDERSQDKVVSSSSAKYNINSKGTSDATLPQADEVLAQYEGDADVEAILPKLHCPDYYIKPPIQELAAKERTEPGFCRRVKDFVVGREGYGSIRFLGETDVRNLDLESLVQFNYREVIVYMDTSKKPQVGQGLNKPAEVTLLNVKCIDKCTGKQYVDGSKINKWRDMLIKKAVEQDAEFVSYNPVSGEWKFRVQHF